ncbi:hypothetical protein ACO22_06973 [Paracoccidioides brasiliensis]|uniref:Uncharacterized protein n=1 Tax=Paracoccidioides brasiliensis TaxID=121759 RepID=A0A1D2J5X9_PARBR|nr:hypothetical protein ACO22_06973 [Paracoccidioides brasiliensis]
MPLHLAIMCGTPEIVQCLVNRGARLVSRVAGGFTSPHLAAARGDVRILRAILRKSEANQVEYLEKSNKNPETAGHNIESDGDDDEEGEGEFDGISVMRTGPQSPYAATQGSMVIVTDPSKVTMEEQNDEEDEPNFYDNLGVISWDIPLSPLHVAILNGHVDIVNCLATEFGVDVNQPFVKKEYSQSHVLFSMLLAMHHPFEISKALLQTLLELGASSTQADMQHLTAFYSLVMVGESRLLDAIFKFDGPASHLAINHPTVTTDWRPRAVLPLTTAVRHKGIAMIEKSLDNGGTLSVPTECHRRFWARQGKMMKIEACMVQLIVKAAEFSTPVVVRKLLDAGADPNTMTIDAYALLDSDFGSSNNGRTVLDVIGARKDFLKSLIQHRSKPITSLNAELKSDAVYLDGLMEGTFEYSFVQKDLAMAKIAVEVIENELNSKRFTEAQQQEKQKADGIKHEIGALEKVEQALKAKGGKIFAELHPTHDGNAHVQHGRDRMPLVLDDTTLKKFEINYTFTDQDVGDLDMKQYLPLFQAAWDGDLVRVKQLTTEPQALNKSSSSLQLTAMHKVRLFDPFTIAVAQGHFKLARAILQDVEAQQVQADTKKTSCKVYEVVVDSNVNDYSSSGETDDDSDNDGVGVHFNIVNDQQTIDDV